MALHGKQKTNTLFYFEKCDNKIIATESTTLDNDDEQEIEKWGKRYIR